jgi:diguanylate cyclase (GGDEF)-like protein
MGQQEARQSGQGNAPPQAERRKNPSANRRNDKPAGKIDPTSLLTRAYILALGLIAFFTISGHIVTAHITDQQKLGAELSFHIGRHRSLTQQITLYAITYHKLNQPLEKTFMDGLTNELEEGHMFLTEKIRTTKPFQGHLSDILFKIYFDRPFQLDKYIKEYAQLIREFSEIDPNVMDPQRVEQRAALIEKIKFMSEKKLRYGLEAAFEQFQSENLDKITLFYTMQFAGAIFILIVLLAEALFIFRPIIGRIREYNIVMQKYALEDSLTGLRNRRAFMNASTAELKRAMRERTGLSVALMDLDHFKSVNDTYGHDVGDKVLKHFSSILKSSFRATDIVGRIGGEEFAVVLPRISRKGAITILQRLCDRVRNSPCQYQDANGEIQELHYTVSIGFTGPTLIRAESVDELLVRADEALYKAKEHGRDCVQSDTEE